MTRGLLLSFVTLFISISTTTTAQAPPVVDTLTIASAKLMVAAKAGELDGNAWFYDDNSYNSETYSSTKLSINGCKVRLTRTVKYHARRTSAGNISLGSIEHYRQEFAFSFNISAIHQEGGRSRTEFERTFRDVGKESEDKFTNETTYLQRHSEWSPSNPCRTFVIGIDTYNRDFRNQYRVCASSLERAKELQQAVYTAMYWCTAPELK